MGEISDGKGNFYSLTNVIYSINNIINGKCYVGSTKYYDSRKNQHLCGLRKGNHHSSPLQEDYIIYGNDAFIFTILELNVPSINLLIREQFYIDTLNTAYNICKVAGSRKGMRASIKTRLSMSISRKGVPIHTLESKEAISKASKGNTYQLGNKNKRKVTPEILVKVNKLRDSGLGCRKIAKIINLDKTTILNIFNNKYNYE